MICPQCNNEIQEGKKFCRICGYKVVKTEEAQDTLHPANRNLGNLPTLKLAYVTTPNEILDDELASKTVGKDINGMVWYIIEEIESQIIFKYTIRHPLSLSEALTNDRLKKNEFLQLILNTIETFANLSKLGFDETTVTLIPKNIYVDKDCYVRFMPIPVKNRRKDSTFKNLLNHLIKIVRLDMDEDCEFNYLEKLAKEVNSKKELDLVAMQQFVESLINDSVRNNQVQQTMQQSQDNINNGQVQQAMEQSQKNTMQGTKSLFRTNIQDEDEDDEGTTTLGEDEGTTILQNKVQNEYLYRISTEEKIVIDKEIFRIGHSAKSNFNNDYVVKNNSAISRGHCYIKKENNNVYIVDLGSSNGTYINGNRIESNVEMKLNNEDIIMLGNEEFKFYME